MLRVIRRTTLQVMRSCGVFALVANSKWRSARLLILCYHGVSRLDEHLWRPTLYMEPSVLRGRLEMLKSGAYNVLRLGEGLERLQRGTLPPRSVAITFDDGGYDFYEQAYPQLKRYAFPATVYQTTYYSDHQMPVFNLICSYMLWQRRGTVLQKGTEVGLSEPMDLRTEESRFQIVRTLILNAEADDLTGAQKDERARHLAELLDLDYDGLLARRTLFLMNRSEIAELAAAGFDVQLHTHRHRTPIDQQLFRKEIEDNRRSLSDAGQRALHFCYPSGVYWRGILPWLRTEKVLSATTCDAGLASVESNPLLLPRLVDTSARTPIEFEGWLTGVGALLAFRKTAPRIVPAAAGHASQVAD